MVNFSNDAFIIFNKQVNNILFLIIIIISYLSRMGQRLAVYCTDCGFLYYSQHSLPFVINMTSSLTTELYKGQCLEPMVESKETLIDVPSALVQDFLLIFPFKITPYNFNFEILIFFVPSLSL